MDLTVKVLSVCIKSSLSFLDKYLWNPFRYIYPLTDYVAQEVKCRKIKLLKSTFVQKRRELNAGVIKSLEENSFNSNFQAIDAEIIEWVNTVIVTEKPIDG